MRGSRQFYFLNEKISHTQKAQKAQNVNKQLSSFKRFSLSLFLFAYMRFCAFSACLKNKTVLIPSFILLLSYYYYCPGKI